MKQTKILLVCPGNVVRSAFGEALLKKYAADHGLPWVVHSVGTNRWHKVGSASADPRAIAAAHLNNIDLTSHVPRRFQPYHFDDYDVIYSMAASTHRALKKLTRNPEQMKKVRNFMDVLYPGEGRETPNPWFMGDEKEFLRCFETVELACRLMVHRYHLH